MDVLKKLKQEFDQAELLTLDTEELKISLENWDLQDLSQENLSRSSLRVIKDGQRGANTSFGKSDKVNEKLIKGAKESVRFGEKSYFDFSSSKVENKEDKQNNNKGQEEIVDYLQEFLNFVKEKKSDFPLVVNFKQEWKEITIKTTEKGDLFQTKSNYSLGFGAPIPGGGSMIYRMVESPEFFTELPEEEIENFMEEYRLTEKVSVPETDSLPVVFSPRALYFLFVSLQEGISARNIFRETSPLLDRLGDKIFSKKLTIIDRPHMDKAGSRRAFDDEGIPTQKQKIVENGELKTYIYDLEHAARMDAEPKGNGMKSAMFGSGIDTPVTPGLVNPVIEPGDKSKKEIIGSIENGILVDGIVGFHSSNYHQGHFSVQAHGFHIKNGALKGRLQDVMIAGNIYEDFQRVEEIGNKLYPAYTGYTPYVLVDGIKVTGK
ncbi:MAG: metallopeptidase TldD-related protein [Halanaerobiales bacterium]